jgi:allophanate hydrolase subunit 2
MGCRLEGPVIEHREAADVISDGLALGAIQVPANGKPIIMLADHQTTGGYTQIAHVISVDIAVVAQKKPGDRLRFKTVSIEEAQQLYREREQRIACLADEVRRSAAVNHSSAKDYTLIVNGYRCRVRVEEIEKGTL